MPNEDITFVVISAVTYLAYLSKRLPDYRDQYLGLENINLILLYKLDNWV